MLSFLNVIFGCSGSAQNATPLLRGIGACMKLQRVTAVNMKGGLASLYVGAEEATYLHLISDVNSAEKSGQLKLK